MNTTVVSPFQILFFTCILFLGFHAQGQENLKGKVIDATDGQPLIGAQIVLKPSNK